LGQLSQALEEGIEALSGPGAKEAKESRARVRAFRAARAAADLACDDQRAHTAFSQVIMGGRLRPGHKDEQFR
jgi:hypothetical protein